MIQLLAFALLVLLMIAVPGLWVRHVKRRYRVPADRYAATGAELARALLQQQGIRAAVEESQLGDCYDAAARAVRLAPVNFHGRSLTAVAVSAHQVGHAMQHEQGDAPSRWRATLLHAGSHAEGIGAVMLVAGPLVAIVAEHTPFGLIMAFTGFLALFVATLANLLALPRELDASLVRALPLLQRGGHLHAGDLPHIRRLLTAEAMSPLGAALLRMLDVSRWRRRFRR